MTEPSMGDPGVVAADHMRLLQAVRAQDRINGHEAARTISDRIVEDRSGSALDELLELVDEQLSRFREEHPDRLDGGEFTTYLGEIEGVLRSARQRVSPEDSATAQVCAAIQESEVLTRVFRAQCAFDDGAFGLAESLVVEGLAWPVIQDSPVEMDLREVYGEVLLQQGDAHEGLFELNRAAELAGELRNVRAAALLHDRVGLVAAQQNDDALSADAFSAAGIEWAEVGETDEAAESNRSALFAAVDAAQAKAADGQLQEGARFLALAESLAGRDDELDLAGARLRLGLAFAMQHRGDTALLLMTAAQPALEAHDDDELLLLLHLGLAVAHLFVLDASEADVSAREAARRAHLLGEAELEAMTLQLVASLGMSRGDAGALESVHAALAALGMSMGSSPEADVAELIRRWTAGEAAAAAEQSRLIIDRHGHDPECAHTVAPARLFLLLAAAAARDRLAARHQLDLLERLRADEGDPHVAAGLDLVLPLARALMTAAEGDDDAFGASLDALRLEHLRNGAASMAGHLLGVLATWRFAHGRTDVTDDLVVSLLSELAEYRTLPSSAERAGTRALIAASARTACEAAVRAEDWQLLSELIETLRAQGIPIAGRMATGGALNRLLEVMVSDAVGTAAARPFAQPTAETTLPADAYVRMPWGTLALERQHIAARPYLTRTTDDVVRLRILS